MKIIYDKICSNSIYPISKKDMTKIKERIPIDIANSIKLINFGCNKKSTQEGRLVQKGELFEIRVNFCLNDSQSDLKSVCKKYTGIVENFGGKIDFDNKIIKWELKNAKKYSLFILFHEIAHINYCKNYSDGKLAKKSSSREESWCDSYSTNKISKINI